MPACNLAPDILRAINNQARHRDEADLFHLKRLFERLERQLPSNGVGLSISPDELEPLARELRALLK